VLPLLGFWNLHTHTHTWSNLRNSSGGLLSENWGVHHAVFHSVPGTLPITYPPLSSMAQNNTTVSRTAPIPIAPKPPRPELATHQDSPRRFEIGSVGLHTTSRSSVESAAVLCSVPTSTQPVPPCRACQYSGTRCILSEDDDGCVPCQVNATDCSLSSPSLSPGSRKRKLDGGLPSREISGKRRFVTTLPSTSHLIILRLSLTHPNLCGPAHHHPTHTAFPPASLFLTSPH
jgi:hypothetical protein